MKESLFLLKDLLEHCKYTVWVSQNVHSDKLADRVSNYNNTNHNTNKMKSVYSSKKSY